MKKLFVSLLILALSGFTFADGHDDSIVATGNAESLRIKMYKFYVAESANCTDPVLVYENDAPTYTSMSEAGTLFQEELSDGTYNCVIIVMSDHIKATPETNVGTACVAGVENTQDVCQPYQGEGEEEGDDPFLIVDNVDGTQTTCTDGEDQVVLWLTTAVTAASDENMIFRKPTATGLPSGATASDVLETALVVSGATNGTFYVDVSGKIEARDFGEGDETCEMGKPDFGFINE